MNYIVKGLLSKPFQHLYGMQDNQLAALGVYRVIVSENPGFPERIEMQDAQIGDTLLLVNHTSVDKPTPYRTSHAVFIREGAIKTFEAENTIPPVMYNRLLSLRAFDNQGMMLDATLAQGDQIEKDILQLFENREVAHIDAHYALRGCYSGRIFKN